VQLDKGFFSSEGKPRARGWSKSGFDGGLTGRDFRRVRESLEPVNGCERFFFLNEC